MFGVKAGAASIRHTPAISVADHLDVRVIERQPARERPRCALVQHRRRAGSRGSEAQPDRQWGHGGVRPDDRSLGIAGEVEGTVALHGLGGADIAERQPRRGGGLAASALERLDPPNQRPDARFGFGCDSLAGSLRHFTSESPFGLRQHEVPHSQAIQHLPRARWQLAPVAEKPARRHRQARDQIEPVVLIQLGGGHGRCRGLRVAFCQPGGERSVAQAQARRAQDGRLHRRRQHLGKIAEAGIGRLDQHAPGVGRHRAKQVQQLPVLRARRRLALRRVAQHRDKAIVEQHSILWRKAPRARSFGAT